MTRWASAVILVVALLLASISRPTAQSGEGDPATLAMMAQINQRLAAAGLDIAVEQIQFFTIGQGRPANRRLAAASLFRSGWWTGRRTRDSRLLGDLHLH